MDSAMPSAFDELKARDAASLCPTYGCYPLAVDRAQGCRLYDLERLGLGAL